MASYYRKRPQLSEQMSQLKKKIQSSQKIPLLQQIHRDSTILSTVSSGIANSINLLSAILVANKDIPVIGFFMQMVAMIPRSISTLTDPDKSIGEKIFASVVIGTIVGLSIAAFIIGAVAATIIGTAAALFITAMEGIILVGQIVEKLKTSRLYHKKRDFEELIAKRQVPDDKFDEILEVRAVELRHLLTNKALTQEEKHTLLEESKFIEMVLKNKNIIIADNPKSSAFALQKLYKKREEFLTKLIGQISLVDSKADPIPGEDIQSLQEQIALIDKKITEITPSIEQLNIENMIASEKLSLAFSGFLVATSGSLLSVIGLLLVLGSVAFPPVITPILIGFGIGLAAVSLAKFTAEKFAEHQDANDKQKRSTDQKEFILEEALYGYEYQLNPDNPGVGVSSHTKYMHGLLPKNEPAITTPPDTSLKTYESPVFKKHAPSDEITNSPEKTPIDDVTPP